MPLSMANAGQSICIHQIQGKDETRRFLENLGFTAGERITVVTKIQGNLIVNVKDTRIAISNAMANKIHVD